MMPNSPALEIRPGVLTRRTAVVTGSSTGIGQAIAERLAAAGYNLVIHGRSHSPALQECHARLTDQGASVQVITCDFTQTASLVSFVEQCWQAFGSVDVWINNAGADILTASSANWDFAEKLALLWQVDVQATIVLSREVGRRMRADAAKFPGDRVIVNMGWDQADQGMEGDSGQLFGTTKGAVQAFTRSLALELAPQIRVNAVAPGWIQTEWSESTSEYWNQRAIAESAMERWGRPADVAHAVHWLVDPASTFITGQITRINGGFRFGQIRKPSQ